MKFKRPSKSPTKISTLLIDGESLLKQGFYGTKKTLTKNGRVGTIYFFINTIRRFYIDYNITKVVVFWEGEDSKKYRQAYYPYYKSNRNDKYTSEEDIHDLDRQRVRVKTYLEEIFIRQIESYGCEADDGIAIYVKNSPNEIKTIYTNDRDLLQLLDEDVSVYLSNIKRLVTINNFNEYFDYHYKNVGVIKAISGDSSDNISGIENIGEKTVIKLFPELKTEPKTVDWVKEQSKLLLSENPKNNKLKSIVEGNTKYGSYGEQYFTIMDKIINLNTPNITEELYDDIISNINDTLNPDGRGEIKTILKLMREDELLTYLPRGDDSFFDFWSPFIAIINKEKNNYENYKN